MRRPPHSSSLSAGPCSVACLLAFLLLFFFFFQPGFCCGFKFLILRAGYNITKATRDLERPKKNNMGARSESRRMSTCPIGKQLPGRRIRDHIPNPRPASRVKKNSARSFPDRAAPTGEFITRQAQPDTRRESVIKEGESKVMDRSSPVENQKLLSPSLSLSDLPRFCSVGSCNTLRIPDPVSVETQQQHAPPRSHSWC
ncbi:hypothetical protein MAPG_04365 [Magnaporthiopsis poae ATCC 64411]|uniref:Uncharacterized protein n=1 Tax=Magnaporthiopsis poae (strain ATCC 64411 / 73-15) TaxID=644358 RepID=A0A0C4DWI4_MAGP6|nr:hypothetical protein MAPG_04365 [Magnaporthiopsis poae ATCC 64411]